MECMDGYPDGLMDGWIDIYWMFGWIDYGIKGIGPVLGSVKSFSEEVDSGKVGNRWTVG